MSKSDTLASPPAHRIELGAVRDLLRVVFATDRRSCAPISRSMKASLFGGLIASTGNFTADGHIMQKETVERAAC